MRHINQLDLFSGIGGFHLGFEKAGYKVTSYFSEIDKHAIAVYKHKFKDSTYVGSVTDVRGADLPAIDLITFGSPCQDFSLAGKRAGMEGQRSSLILEAIRLIRECRPSVFVWENVKGTFSSNNGADFWAIIQAFANIGGYRLEWQLLNTSWVLPQNRERIYLVGYSTTPTGDWRGVFPVGEDRGAFNELHRQDSKTLTCRYTADSNGSFIGEREQSSQEVKQVGTKLDSNGGTPNCSILKINQAVVQPVQIGQSSKTYAAQNGTLIGKDGQDAFTIRSSNPNGVNDGYRIRRLTPIECERLQGFPDNHTAYGNYDGEVKPMSNTQRYKQCGNAVTVDIVALVAKQLKPIFDALPT
jgi:DNA (cytosine-5)-methyltransferase 1